MLVPVMVPARALARVLVPVPVPVRPPAVVAGVGAVEVVGLVAVVGAGALLAASPRCLSLLQTLRTCPSAPAGHGLAPMTVGCTGCLPRATCRAQRSFPLTWTVGAPAPAHERSPAVAATCLAPHACTMRCACVLCVWCCCHTRCTRVVLTRVASLCCPLRHPGGAQVGGHLCQERERLAVAVPRGAHQAEAAAQ